MAAGDLRNTVKWTALVAAAVILLLVVSPVVGQWQCEEFRARLEQSESQSKPQLRQMCSHMEELEARVRALESQVKDLQGRIEAPEGRTD